MSEPIKLWLDDVRDPNHYGFIGWTWVKTVEKAIELLESGQVEKASLDHDLSISASLGCAEPKEVTGYDLVCWMEKNRVWPKGGVSVHSMNPSGAARMRQVIEKACSHREGRP